MLSDGQLRDRGLDDVQLCGNALVLASLDVEVGFDPVVHLGLDQLERLLNDVA